MRINLGTKISLLTSLLVFVSVGILGYFLYQNQRNNLIDSAIEGGKGQVRLEGAKLEESISELINDVRFLAKTPPIQGIVRAKANSGIDPVDGSTEMIWRQRLESIFKAFISEKKQYLQVRYIGKSGEGKEIVRVDIKDGKPYIVEVSNLQAKGDQAYVLETLKLSGSATYLSPISLNREHGKVTIPHTAVLRAAVPIYDANEKAFGIVVINLDFGSILDELTKHDEHLSIVNSDGDYLGNQKSELNFGFDLGQKHQIQTTYPELASFLGEGSSDNDFTYISQNLNREEAVYVLKVQYDLSFGRRFIGLVHIEKISEIMARSESVVNKTLLLVFELITIATLAGFYFSRRLTSPLRQISRAAALFAEEDQEGEGPHLPLNSRDEIGDLARSFQAMIKKVKVRTRELEFQKRAIDEHAIVSIADTKGNITYVNDKFCQVSGYSRDELLGENHRILFSGEHPPEFFENMWETIANGKVWQGDVKNKNKKEGYYWVRTTIVPNLNNDGKPFQYIGIRTEITENKNLEEALTLSKKQAEKANHAKSEFLSKMSHELRTPLNAILGFSQLMMMDRDNLTDIQKDNIERISSSGKHLLELINEVLDLARIEAGHVSMSIEPVLLEPLITDVIAYASSIAIENAVEIVDQTSEFQGHYVMADRTRLKQVLLNLMSNGIKYNRQGGTLTLSIQIVNDNKLCFNVTDTGQGIREDQFLALFEPFNRLDAENTEIQGTGIGLTVTKELTELMGGTIEVESKVGEGSTFKIILPLTQPKEDLAGELESKVKEYLTEATGHQVTILYVEDNPLNLEVVRQALANIPNIKLLSAHEAQLGIDLAKTQKVDLILMDINLKGMDGLRAMQILKNIDKTSHIPVIALSANAMQRDIDHALEAGFLDYIVKPINVADFIATIRQVIQGLRGL